MLRGGFFVPHRARICTAAGETLQLLSLLLAMSIQSILISLDSEIDLLGKEIDQIDHLVKERESWQIDHDKAVAAAGAAAEAAAEDLRRLSLV